MKVPVLILAFNRPDHVRKAMEAVRTYQPSRLYLACDGPRDSKEGEAALVLEVQQTMQSAVDWDCEVQTLFRQKNLGCGQAVYQAISWFFQHEDYGVIIEDDVLVGQDFFRLCEDLLPRYAGVPEIMAISAENHSGRQDIPHSYVYTPRFNCWGWASWRRAWNLMDMDMTHTKSVSPWFLTRRLGLFEGLMMYYYFMGDYYHFIPFDTWDLRWFLSILVRRGLVICPGVNLAVNIGMSGGAHYEEGDANPYAHLRIGSMSWPLVYNDQISPDPVQSRYDKADFRQVRLIGLRKKIKKLFRR